MSGEQVMVLALAWEKTSAALSSAKKAEAEARVELVKALETSLEGKAGTNTHTLLDGRLAKVNRRSEAQISKVEDYRAAESLIAADGELGAEVVKRLATWKPSISLRELRALPEKFAALLVGIVSEKVSPPTVEIVTAPAKA